MAVRVRRTGKEVNYEKMSMLADLCVKRAHEYTMKATQYRNTNAHAQALRATGKANAYLDMANLCMSLAEVTKLEGWQQELLKDKQ